MGGDPAHKMELFSVSVQPSRGPDVIVGSQPRMPGGSDVPSGVKPESPRKHAGIRLYRDFPAGLPVRSAGSRAPLRLPVCHMVLDSGHEAGGVTPPSSCRPSSEPGLAWPGPGPAAALALASESESIAAGLWQGGGRGPCARAQVNLKSDTGMLHHDLRAPPGLAAPAA